MEERAELRLADQAASWSLALKSAVREAVVYEDQTACRRDHLPVRSTSAVRALIRGGAAEEALMRWWSSR
jgi:hypothetical protein